SLPPFPRRTRAKPPAPPKPLSGRQSLSSAAAASLAAGVTATFASHLSAADAPPALQSLLSAVPADSPGARLTSLVLLLLASNAAYARRRRPAAAGSPAAASAPPQPAGHAGRYARASLAASLEALRALKRLRRSSPPRAAAGLRELNRGRLLLLAAGNEWGAVLRFLNGADGARAPDLPHPLLRVGEFGDLAGDGADGRFLRGGVDYSLPVHLRGGVDVDELGEDPSSLAPEEEGEEGGGSEEEGGGGSSDDDDASTGSSGWGDYPATSPPFTAAGAPHTSALHLACQLGHLETVLALVAGPHEAGEPLPRGGAGGIAPSLFDGGCADPDKPDPAGWTAAHHAVVAPRNGGEILRALAAAGASLGLEAESGYTPFALGERLGAGPEVLEALRELGADSHFDAGATRSFLESNVAEALEGGLDYMKATFSGAN
ncbi:hypothetical protein TeGR_g10414, partial [Tetraparma gracilis]